MINEELKKSIDSMIDELFLEKSADSKTKADDAVNAAPKGQDDDKRGAGRPDQISDVPKTDKDGKRSGDYDKDIAKKQKEEENAEAKKQVKEKNQIKKSEEEAAAAAASDENTNEDLEKSEREELEAFRAAKKDQEAEEFKKAEEDKQEDLIKSVVEKVSTRYEEKIENLTKSLNEQTELVKAIANKPQQSKSITNIEAMEKSTHEEGANRDSFTKSEMLDAAEELFHKGEIRDTEVIELENNGFILNPESRAKVEKALLKK